MRRDDPDREDKVQNMAAISRKRLWMSNRLLIEQLVAQAGTSMPANSKHDELTSHQLPALACCVADTAGFTAAFRAAWGTIALAISSAVFSAAPTHWSIL